MRWLLLIFTFLLCPFLPNLGLSPVSASPKPTPATYYINGQPAPVDSRESLNDVKQVGACETIPGYQRFTDHPRGYSVCVPGNLTPDFSLSAVRSSWQSETTRVEIYYDDFKDSISHPHAYMVYANRFVPDSSRHSIQTHQTFNWQGFTVNYLKWNRTPLASIKQDRNHYASLELLRYPNEAYTIFIKSSQPIDNALEILYSFRLAERRGAPGIFRKQEASKTKLNKETREFRDRYFGPDSPLRWGLFDSDAPERLRGIKELESRLDYKFTVVLRYQTLDERVPVPGMKTAFADGRYTELTLHTIHADAVNALYAGGVRGNQDIAYNILDGKYDEYLREYALSLKQFGHPVLFRLNNEMNGDWCWYSAMYAGKDTEIFKALWRHIHRLFDEAGVDNVLWVWNPHDVSLPDFKWNHPLMYYPGDDVVDIIGITGYNTGTYFAGEKWREFHDIYKPVTVDYSEWFNKPFMITEFGSNSVGGNKAAWIDRMFSELPAYNRIKLAVWWSGIDLDTAGRPGRIYLLDENADTVEAFRKGLKNYRQQNLTDNMNTK
jgi:hypothetical protein